MWSIPTKLDWIGVKPKRPTQTPDINPPGIPQERESKCLLEMPMERSLTAETPHPASAVVAIECIAGGSRAEEWSNGSALQSGDVVEELQIGHTHPSKTPFKGGRAAVQKMLHAAFKRDETSITVRARRGLGEKAEMKACIVPHGKRQYALRSIHDPNYLVGFVDKMESECIAMQGSRSSRMVGALDKAQLQDGYVSYPWEKKMRDSLQIPNASCFISLLVLPKSTDPTAVRYNSLEDTLARANAWLNSSQDSGVPILFMNVQTEGLLTKISGETASATVNTGSLSDLSNLANVSLYGFEDYHGVDIGVVRAVRLWYTPVAGELAVEIRLQEGDTKLGFAISRTDEGFIFISSVIEDDDETAASTRSGIRDLYKEATKAHKLLVISRVANEKVLPWMVASSGAIRCFDTVSLSQKLSLHRHALRPILLHVLMWEQPSLPVSNGFAPYRAAAPPPPVPLQLSAPEMHQEFNFGGASEARLGRDTAGDASFRFHDFALPNNWV